MSPYAACARARRAAPASRALLWFAAAMLAGCTIEEPTLPTFESEWLVPIGEYEKTVQEIIEDEPDFVIGQDGAISLSTSGDLDGVAVGDQLDVDVDGMSFEAAIGNVSIDASDPIGFDNRLGDLYPQAELVDGFTMPVPGFTFDLTTDPQDIPGFESATLASGGLRVEVVNGLPVPVGGTAPPEQFAIVLFDPDTGSTLLDVTVPNAILAGSTFERTFDLSGETIPDQVAVRLTGGSEGSATPVTVDADAQLAVLVQTTPLDVLEAVASFGAQSFVDTSAVEMPDSIQVRSAVISSGTLTFRMRNDLPLDAVATIDIPAFVSDAGAPLQLVVPLAAGSNSTRQADLSDYTMQFDDGLGQDLVVTANVFTPGTDGNSVTIRSSDVISVEVDPLALSFASVTGVVDEISVDLDPETTDIEIPEDLEDLQLQSASLSIGFTTSLGFPLAIDLHIEGTNGDGVMVPLDAVVNVPAVSGPDPEVHSTVLDETNSTIVDFLNNLPESIVFSGSARLGDGVTEGTVAATDSVSARWAISAPLSVALLAQTIESDAEALDLDEDVRQDIEDRLVSLVLEADVVSTLPVEAIAYIGIAPDSLQTFTSPRLELGPITIPAAGAARADGTRDGVAHKTLVEVAQKDVLTITQPGAWTGVRIELPGTNGEFVTLRATDKVVLSGFLRARLMMGDVE